MKKCTLSFAETLNPETPFSSNSFTISQSFRYFTKSWQAPLCIGIHFASKAEDHVMENIQSVLSNAYDERIQKELKELIGTESFSILQRPPSLRTTQQ